ESAWVNTIMVAIKVGIIGLFLFVGLKFVRTAQWTSPSFAPNGFKGISVGAAIIFFSYIGFDAVSTASEEAKNTHRVIPIGIIAALIICTVLYIAIALVITGLIPWDKLNVPDPLAVALQYIHADWAAGILALGAVAAMTSLLLVSHLGQARIFMSMARDGLLPPWAARLHPRYKTPHITTIVTGVFVAVFAAVAPIGVVLELTNIGTLFAFILVALGIITLRRTDPHRARPFRTPWVPFLPILSIGFCLYLIVSLPLLTKLRLISWLVLGAAIYFAYSVRQSRGRRDGEVVSGAPPPVAVPPAARPRARSPESPAAGRRPGPRERQRAAATSAAAARRRWRPLGASRRGSAGPAHARARRARGRRRPQCAGPRPPLPGPR